MEPRLNVITLGVRDLQRSIKFYEEGLGWKRSASSQEAVAFFQVGALVLSLFGWDDLADDAKLPAAGTGFRGISLACNTRSKAETDEVLALAAKAGGQLIKPAEEVFWGGYSGYFADPDGHLFEVAYNPFWELNDKGEVVLPA
ncbi:VOC family protein [Chitinophaga sp. Cy-1792]|uniref:VOC family protein n=1 Tax=Chitinophaga sp. Cy-1792 TaxID=2608339 RepID=UPI00141FDE05|nr:VOC family protein [Chitinophaga sp. Cy-1792]NIG57540.1 VOC family protein [Chitinophaga sp. Cy-1792]